MSRPIAILCSDLHFSHRPPVARSTEPDWYAAMERQWNCIREHAEQFGIPIIVAGDLFDFWKSPPELTNFVIRLFRGLSVFAIPGQHDLPNHVYEDMHRSSYGTLIEAGAIVGLDPAVKVGEVLDENLPLNVWSFPWGFDVIPLEDDFETDVIRLAVSHRYIWKNEMTCYLGAPAEQNIACLKDKLAGYNAAVFGDNHKGFVTKSGKCQVLNCGGFMPRKSDERNYKPSFGLLMDDASIEVVSLPIDEDRWIDREECRDSEDVDPDLSILIGSFEGLGADAFDFADALVRTMDREGTREDVRRMVVTALGKGREDEEK